MSYSLDDLGREVLGVQKNLIPVVVPVSREIMNAVGIVALKVGMDTEISLFGSSNPKRLTFVRDRTNLALFPIDFDIGIVTPDFKNKRVLSRFNDLLPYKSVLKNDFGRYLIKFPFSDFSCQLNFFEDSDQDPLLYTNSVGRILPAERLEIGKLKLLFMREGIYGGFQQGIKGIALEQMVLRYGDAKKVLEVLAEDQDLSKLGIKHPFGRDLLKGIYPSNSQRLKQAAQDALMEEVRSSYFEGFSYPLSGSQFNFFLSNSPRGAFDRVQRVLTGLDFSVLSQITVLPIINSTLVYVNFSADAADVETQLRDLIK